MPRGRKGNNSRGRKSTTSRSQSNNRGQEESTFHEIGRSSSGGQSEEGRMGEK